MGRLKWADVTRSAVMASDVVIIPVQPSGLDVWGAGAVVALLSEAIMVQSDLKAAFVINRKIDNTALARDLCETLGDYRMHTLAASLAQRVAFAESLGSSLTVFDMDPASIASSEVSALVNEVMEFASGKEGDSRTAPSVADSG